MNEETEKIKIQELSELLTTNKPYVVAIDINPDQNYWELGMKTKYFGKDVEVIACLNTTDYTKVISEQEGILTTQDRKIHTLLIRNL